MIVSLKFDYHTSYVHIPDGYITDAPSLQKAFLAWVYDNPRCITETGGHEAFSFGVQDFLTYVNESILSGSNERAYISSPSNPRREHILSISF